MSRVVWRWEEKDLGFRFRRGKGRQATEWYQARQAGQFYVVSAQQRKLTKEQAEQLAKTATEPVRVTVVPNPWQDYGRDWDWVVSDDGLCLNWAGCLERQEVERREDEGVQRAMELVAALVSRDTPVPMTQHLLTEIHRELMAAIYPFAGEWRKVALHKGDGPTKWPLPPGGLQPIMDVIERDVFSRSPYVHDDDEQVFAFVSEVMNEVLAAHPFREGNGRLAFVAGNLLLMQNDMLPLTTYERRVDEVRYFAACEAGRIQKDYGPLAALLAEWEDAALVQWGSQDG